jgi:hypothetical protein
MAARHASRIPATSSRRSATCARISRTLLGPFCRFFPFAAALAFPAAVLGPVACYQG